MPVRSTSTTECDLIVVGTGVIGLAIAWEVSKRGKRVIAIDRADAPHSASWAAAGILPPMDPNRARDPLDRLHGLSHELYPQWVAELESAAGIHVEFQRCGALRVARTPGEAAALRATSDTWSVDGIRAERISHDRIHEFEPELVLPLDSGALPVVYHLPDEGQVRTPRLIKALRGACVAGKVQFVSWPPPIEFHPAANGTWVARAQQWRVVADRICFATGAWTAPVLAHLDIRLELEPRRGQMVLLAPSPVRLRGLINEGPRYLVPRLDSRILVGSTVEDVGFDQSTVPEDLGALKEFATGLVPRLADVPIEASWAGLRPRTGDGYPFLGTLPGHSNAFLAAGHFRDGIQLAPITGRLMRDLILGRASDVDLMPFRADRE